MAILYGVTGRRKCAPEFAICITLIPAMERRRHERVPFRRPVSVYSEPGTTGRAESVDISESGIRLRSDSQFAEESSISLSLTLDEEEETVEVPLAAQARVARCDSAEEGSGYDVGIEFFELSDEAKARLSTLLRKMNGH